MNMAITNGVAFMPSGFGAGLDVWSSEDGLAGSATYDAAPNAAFVAGDQDFGGCLEIQKTASVAKIRYMRRTPIFPGCYLQVSARIKVMSGAFPSVRIAGYPLDGTGAHVAGRIEAGPLKPLEKYGNVYTVRGIVGTGTRGGVDLSWGPQAAFGHLGLDLVGPNGAVVRIESIEIQDVTEAFLRDSMDWVDVRDYGATGDGTTDDREAFLAADADAQGRAVLVGPGVYRLGASLSMAAPMRFQGRVTMAAEHRLQLLSNFDFPTYADAFGDEQIGLEKGLQALLTYSDHTVFDLCGRRVEVTRPLRIADYAPGLGVWSNRRVLTNGQLNAVESTAWTPVTVSAQATYSTLAPYTLSNVANPAAIPVGALIGGTGVGREVYVRAVNPAQGQITLSRPLHGGNGTRTYSFTRNQYMLDFSGATQLDRFHIDQVEFLCNKRASGVMLAPDGQMFHMHDCMMLRPAQRAVTSIGDACQDMVIDRCEFLAPDMELTVPERTSLALNANKNDVKIRNSRFVMFGHTMILAGTGNLIVGNHWFQNDYVENGTRTAGLIFANTNPKSAVTGNYIDNCVLEWTNEYDADPAFGTGWTFGGLTVTGNVFTANNVAPNFCWLSVKPYGSGHYLHGVNVSHNTFRTLFGFVDRVEKVDTTHATLDAWSHRNVTFEGNNYHGITDATSNPVYLQHDQATAQTVWSVDPSRFLPFRGQARNVESLVFEGKVTNASGARITEMPFVNVDMGTAKDRVTVNFSQAAKGRAQLRVRMDNPN